MIFNEMEKDYIVNIELFRPPTPPIDFYTRENSKGGSKTIKKRFTDMILPVPVTIYGRPTVEDVKEDMTNWLIHDEPKKLVFKEKPDRYYMAEYESVELDERKYRAKGHINFYLADGSRFGETHKLSLIYSLQKHEIKGQKSTPWKTRTVFTRPSSRYELRNGDGQTIRLNYEFIEGDVLEIDYATRDIKLNGNDLAVALSIQSEWFELPVGDVYLEATHDTEMTYTERYY